MPLIAGLAHHQFFSIHPYNEGNGRTARLLANFILQSGGYGLKGCYALEEYYAAESVKYFEVLVGPVPDYSQGREEADVSAFLSFFCEGMAEAFSKARQQVAKLVEKKVEKMAPSVPLDPSRFDRRQRLLVELFNQKGCVNAAEMAEHLGMQHGSILPLCRKWQASGFIEPADASRKNRCYRLRRY